MNASISHAEQPLLQAMIDGQLRPNGVTDHALLANCAALPRSLFGASSSISDAALTELYTDQPFVLNANRSLLPPRTAARLVQALRPDANSRVLILAAGTGYEAALLAPLAGTVVACEDDTTLQPVLRQNLKNYPNVTVLPHPPTQVPASSAPFTHLLVAAPFAALAPKILQSLAPQAHMAGVRVANNGVPTAFVSTRHGQTWLEEALFESAVGPIPAALQATEHFVF